MAYEVDVVNIEGSAGDARRGCFMTDIVVGGGCSGRQVHLCICRIVQWELELGDRDRDGGRAERDLMDVQRPVELRHDMARVQVPGLHRPARANPSALCVARGSGARGRLLPRFVRVDRAINQRGRERHCVLHGCLLGRGPRGRR
jgi:hypothetical protein